MISPSPSNKRKPSNKCTSKAFFTVFGLFAAVVASVASVFICLTRQPEDTEPVVKPKHSGVITEVTPTLPVPRQEPKSVEPPAPPKPDFTAKYKEMKALSPKEREDVRIAALQERPLNLTPATNRIVNTATEQLMGWIFMTEVGELPPPLPKIPDHEMLHFAEILMADNPVYEDDSERTAEAKEAIRLAKKELAEYIKKGGEPGEFFRYYRGELEQAYKSRQIAKQSVQEILRQEPEIALEYLDKVNERLESQGIKKITLHPKQLEHFGIIVEETER